MKEAHPRRRASRRRARSRPLAGLRQRSPLVWALLAGGLLLASSPLGAGGRSPAELGSETRSRRESRPALHGFATEALFARAEERRPHEDVRHLRSELASLAAEIEAAQKDPSEPSLRALRDRGEAVELAFGALRERMEGGGRSGLAAELAALFAPLWSDVDEALRAPEGRPERLVSARARIDAALAGPSRTHGASFSVVEFEPEE